ncbi:beta-glucosidase [Segetibacter sp. 3557_3]|uniref:GH1 family beta-glucosidase n=1 Tax=Segetibacter sp. 3557_3 TaxID=2547429 RepID=UPI00105877E3|nr:GH1 family beta-glucosidase [Segetibacter sp. 3557_3]TDH23273.1 beta-glucosidase [Segetibacter sp. 3557_3]
MGFTTKDFGPDFKWGVSTAAYQIEGASTLDGKGASIWDVFANTKGKTYQNQHANTSCDFYHHYAQDIALMSIMNIPNFRFSISWSRIMPEGTGKVNYKGIDFYNKVIDFCLQLGIEPWITLYHWDLPYELEKKGGWANREIVNWFSDYVHACITAFGSRVKHWMVLNEPVVFTGAGYFLGIHAPGRKGLNSFLAATHHAALCKAEGGRILRSMRSDLCIGTTFNASYIQPYSMSKQDELAAKRVDALVNKLFVEPLVGLGYPVKDLPLLQRLEQFVKSGDEQRLAFDMDFIGVQNYTREIVAASLYKPLIWATVVKANKRGVETTLMNWEVYPECIYHVLHRFNSYKPKALVVTENGAAYEDVVIGGEVADTKRKQYLEDHISQVARAKKEGINVTGYFVWSFTDNFEWAEGYRPRFGLVHVNFETQQRIVKQSGKWYSKLITETALVHLADAERYA